MRILYVAGAIVAPGSHGGATHVVEVASELAKLGHELHVICARPSRRDPARLILPVAGGLTVQFYRYSVPKWLALLAYPWLAWLARRIKPDLVMERYYNFAGAGMLYARRHHLPALLEVNALMLDPLNSRKRKIDRLLLFNRLKWWAEKQCTWADRIITPLHTTVPASIPRQKIVELPWGANVAMFDRATLDPAAIKNLRQELSLPEAARVAVFAGSFRHWHGVDSLVKAALEIVSHEAGIYFLLLGSGPLYEPLKAQVQAAGQTERVIMPGAIAYDKMPLYLALADCGVAPFDTSKHAPLREAGFFWSPLKIFEYMALNLPTITADIRPLNQIIRPGQDGLLFKEGDIADLKRAICEMLATGDDAEQRRKAMGVSARQRVVAAYSWEAHCRAINQVVLGL